MDQSVAQIRKKSRRNSGADGSGGWAGVVETQGENPSGCCHKKLVQLKIIRAAIFCRGPIAWRKIILMSLNRKIQGNP